MLNSSFFETALESVSAMSGSPYRVTYRIWDAASTTMVGCEFYLMALNDGMARRLAIQHCRDENGTPFSYFDLETQCVGKANGKR